VRKVLNLTIALSLTLVCDKAFNGSELTAKLFENSAAATHWAERAGERAAHSVSGF
jgi:hypothetical protein